MRLPVRARLTVGRTLTTTLVTPDIISALCLKAYAYAGRSTDRDALDIWRLLEAADAAGLRAADWKLIGARRDAARALHRSFGIPSGRGVTTATRDPRQQTRIRALVHRIIANPTWTVGSPTPL